MKRHFLVLTLAVGLIAAGWSQSASAILYNVNRSIGSGGLLGTSGVTGTITTDGTIGILNQANITDWNLALDDGSHPVPFNARGPLSGLNSFVSIFNEAFTATETDLLFDFSAAFDGFLIFGDLAFLGDGAQWCLGVGLFNPCSDGPPSESVRIFPTPFPGEFSTRTGVVSIASVAPVPEPASLALLGIGLAGLGFFRRKTHHTSRMAGGCQTTRNSLPGLLSAALLSVLLLPATANAVIVDAGDILRAEFDLSGQTPAPPWDTLNWAANFSPASTPGTVSATLLESAGGPIIDSFAFVSGTAINGLISAFFPGPADLLDAMGVIQISFSNDNVSVASISVNGFSQNPFGSTQFVAASIRVVQGAVPEPASLALLGIGLAGLGFARTKRAR